MKKIIPLLLCFLFLWGCGADTVTAADAPLEDISAELQRKYKSADVTVLNSEYLLILYGLDESDYAEASAFRVKRLAFPDDIVLLRATDESGKENLLKCLNDYRSSLLEQSLIYEPASCTIIQNCAVETEGLYVWMFLSDRHNALTDIFRSHLKSYAPGEAPVFPSVPTSENNPESEITVPSESVPQPEPVPEPAPTENPEPAAEPEPVTEPAVLPFGLVPESERAEDSWFRDSILIGTSVAENLRDYVFRQRLGENPYCMDNTVFFTAVNYSYFKALETPDALSPALEGDHCSVEDAVSRTGAKRVY